MHFVVKPLTLVLLAVGPDISAASTNFVHFEITVVNRSICEGKLSFAVLFALKVLAFVNGTVRPSFDTKAMLLVVSPISLIASPVCVSVSSLAIGLIVLPLALVYVSVGME